MLLSRALGPATAAGLLLAVTAAAAAWGSWTGAHGHAPAPARAVQTAARPDPPSGTAARRLIVVMRPRESLSGALHRGGLDTMTAIAVAGALADEFDVVNPHPGQRLTLTLAAEPSRSVARPGDTAALVGLSLNPSDESALDLRRGADGAFQVTRTETPTVVTQALVTGRVEGSLYLTLVGKGLDPDLAARVLRLLGRRLDLGRDIQSGDPFRLVFEQPRRVGAPATGAPDLLYAEIVTRAGPVALYRFDPTGGGPSDYVDGEAGPRGVILLRTPVDGARVSSAFGPRLHPILGYTRLHQGVDFAAPIGAPILAAGDGVVEEARWSGGYGRWLRIRHDQGLETGYGHLSAWAAGVGPGARVRQGQVVAYVGASGLATGPHLHFEVFRSGTRVDPAAVDRQGARPGDPARVLAFRARKADVDAQVASIEAACGHSGSGSGNASFACTG